MKRNYQKMKFVHINDAKQNPLLERELAVKRDEKLPTDSQPQQRVILFEKLFHEQRNGPGDYTLRLPNAPDPDAPDPLLIINLSAEDIQAINELNDKMNKFEFFDIAEFNDNLYAQMCKTNRAYLIDNDTELLRKRIISNISNIPLADARVGIINNHPVEFVAKLSKAFDIPEFIKTINRHYSWSTVIDEGINPAHLDELTEWIHKNQNTANRIDVIFDWGRTLSCEETIPIDVFDTQKISRYLSRLVKDKKADERAVISKFKTDVLVYLMGGLVRFQYLTTFFKSLDKKVKIFIITDNDIVCKTPETSLSYSDDGYTQRLESLIEFINKNNTRLQFVQLIQMLIPRFKDNNLIYIERFKSDDVSHAFKKHIGVFNRVLKRRVGVGVESGGKPRRKTRRTAKHAKRKRSRRQ